MKKRELEIVLSRVPPHPKPNPRLEQYQTPSPVAAALLYNALALGDLAGKRVIDLGCGTGILAIGASLCGAATVRGIDADEGSIEVARECAKRLSADVVFDVSKVGDVTGSYDTVIQNPPFGAQNRHADRPFLEKAIAIAPVVYSFHLKTTEAFVESYAADLAADFTHKWDYDFALRHQFVFHEKAVEHVKVVLFRFQRRDD
ncbi:MAG: methyltransferase [Euryarchaeota archaeon]|nr:methyltransferase [Euryarchaeota archaeon]